MYSRGKTLVLFAFLSVAFCLAPQAVQAQPDNTGDNESGETGNEEASSESSARLVPISLQKRVFDVAATQIARANCKDGGLPAARAAYHDGDLTTVETTLRSRLACDASAAAPDSPERFLLARVTLESGQPQQTLEILTESSVAGHVVDDFVQMTRAEAFRAMGLSAGAAEIYGQVKDQRYSQRYHEAVVEQAVAYFEAGMWEKALEGLDYVLDTYEEHPRFERLLVKRARARMAVGKLKGAANDLDRVIWDWPWKEAAAEARELLGSDEMANVEKPVHDFDSRFDRARWLRQHRHWDLAEAEFRDMLAGVKTDKGDSYAENRIWLQLALNYYGASRYEEALDILYRLAELHENGGGDGTTRSYVYRLIVRCESWSGRFEKALEALQIGDKDISNRARERNLAEFYEDNGRYDKALRYWDKVLSESGQRTWHYAFLLYKAEHYSSAIRKLEWLERRASGSREQMYAYWKGRALMKRGDLEDAREVFTAVEDDDPLHYYGIQAANRLREIDNYLESEQPLVADVSDDTMFANAGDIIASGSETDAGVGSDSEVVPHIISPILQSFATNGSFGASAFSGALDRQVAALSAPLPGQRAVADVPDKKVPEIPTGRAQIYWDRPPFDDLQFASRSVASDADSEGPDGDLMPAYSAGSPVDGALESAAMKWGELFPRLQRAQFLFSVGLETEARWEIRDAALEFRLLRSRKRKPRVGRPYTFTTRLDSHYIDNRREEDWGTWGIHSNRRRYPDPDDSDGRKALSLRQREIIENVAEIERDLVPALKEAGDFHFVRKFAYETRFYDVEPLAAEGKADWMEAYPRAFPRLVQENAEKQGISPYLMWALMRVESTFNPDSISYADARGLLQVIPKTGNKVAATLGVDEYGHYQLLDEKVSIKFGTWYFSQLVKKFHGQELFAIAGYNGGPHNVARWVTSRGHALDMDEFVETIPFDQARGYTKKVLRFAGIYQRLYENNPIIYVGNDLETEFQVHPNY